MNTDIKAEERWAVWVGVRRESRFCGYTDHMRWPLQRSRVGCVSDRVEGIVRCEEAATCIKETGRFVSD